MFIQLFWEWKGIVATFWLWSTVLLLWLPLLTNWYHHSTPIASTSKQHPFWSQTPSPIKLKLWAPKDHFWRRKWQPTPVFPHGESQEEPGGLQSKGSQRVGHDWSNLARTHTKIILGLPRWLGGKKIHLAMQKTLVRSLGREDPLEKEMTAHFNILAWRIPWTEEPGVGYSPCGHKESDMT